MSGSSQECIAPRPLDDGPMKDRGELDGLQQNVARLMTRMRIAVIFGSNKTTPGSVLYQTCNTRSWKSYEAVAQDIALSLERIGFRHVQLMPDDMQLGDRLRREQIHMAWLNTGGVQGYNSAAHASSHARNAGCALRRARSAGGDDAGQQARVQARGGLRRDSDRRVLDLEHGAWPLPAGAQQPVQGCVRRLCRTVHRQTGFRARILACPRRRRPRRAAGHGRSSLSGDRECRPDREIPLRPRVLHRRRGPDHLAAAPVGAWRRTIHALGDRAGLRRRREDLYLDG